MNLKQTDFHKQIKEENRKFNIVKSLAFLRMKLSYGEKRKNYECAYSIYSDEFDLDNRNNAIPGELYYKPTDIILYDLIRKEDLALTKNGLIKLIKKYYSHRFIGGGRFADDIDRLINDLDQSIHNGNSWYRFSIFDFANDNEMDSYIHHFEIFFHNFSASFAAVEMHLTLSDSYTKEMSQFIKEPYKKPGMCVHKNWQRNKRKNGAKIIYGVSSGISSECAKSQVIYEQLQNVKCRFLKTIGKYLPLMLYSMNGNIKSINVYETNITPSLDLERSIYIGMGLDDSKGFFFSPYARLYTNTATSNRWEDDEKDMLFVYNPDLISNYDCYISAHNKMMEELRIEYMVKLYRIVILNDLGQIYFNKIISYRNQVNKCKTDKKNNKMLLKIQYDINKDFYDFTKIDEELPVNKEFEDANTILSQNEYAKKSIHLTKHTYKQFYSSPRWMWERVRTNFTEVEGDLVRKLAISESLTKYKNESLNKWLVFSQVVLAALTLFFVMFPEKISPIAMFIKKFWRIIMSVFK